jgi:hypothetical protein
VALVEPLQVTGLSLARWSARLSARLTAVFIVELSSNEPEEIAWNNVAGVVDTIVCPPWVVTPVTRPRNPFGVAGPLPIATICPTLRSLPPEYRSSPWLPGVGAEATVLGARMRVLGETTTRFPYRPRTRMARVAETARRRLDR